MGNVSDDAHGQPSLSVTPRMFLQCRTFQSLAIAVRYCRIEADLLLSIVILQLRPKQRRFCARLTFVEEFDTGYLVVPEVLLLVEEICSRGTQVDNLRATVAVLLKPCAFEAVEGVGDALWGCGQDCVHLHQYLVDSPRHHKPHTCSGSFQTNIRRICVRALLVGRSYRKQGTCRHICRTDVLWLYLVVSGTSPNRLEYN